MQTDAKSVHYPSSIATDVHTSSRQRARTVFEEEMQPRLAKTDSKRKTWQAHIKSNKTKSLPNINLALCREIVGLVDFLKAAPTAYHAGLAAKALCVRQNGFTELQENFYWNIAPGGKYFLARNESSFIAFVMPKIKPQRCHILAAHTDSPGFKLAYQAEQHSTTSLFAEPFGSPSLSLWTGRKLGLAGRLSYVDKHNQEKTALIDFGKTIASMPCQNNSGSTSIPVACWLKAGDTSAKSALEEEIKKSLSFSKMLSQELFFIPMEEPEIVNEQFLHAPNQESRLSIHAALYALLLSQQPEKDYIKMVVCLDNKANASIKEQSFAFLESTLLRIAEKNALTGEERAILKASSNFITLEPTSGGHTADGPLLGQGPVINHASATWALRAGRACNIPLQIGYTAGKTDHIAALCLGIPTAHIGTPLWTGMALSEVSCLSDHIHLCTLLTELLTDSHQLT